MKLKLVRHLWGVDLTHGLQQYLPRWHDVGYEALEVSIRFVPEREAFLRFLKENAFQWIPQIFSNDFVPGGTVREHLDSLRIQIEECLDHGPAFFNAHSGYDNWSPVEAEDFYGQALTLACCWRPWHPGPPRHPRGSHRKSFWFSLREKNGSASRLVPGGACRPVLLSSWIRRAF